jgi:uncharacterized protein
MADTLDFSSPIPAVLDARKVFRQGLLIRGTLPVSGMTRLATLLQDGTGSVTVQLQFGHDESHRRRIQGQVNATVMLQCQRCLEPLAVELDETVNLALVSSEAIAEKLPADIDPWLSDEEQLAPAEIIEEQLILGLPIVASHQQCELAIKQNNSKLPPKDSADPVQNPFAVLATLKNNRD